MIPSIHRPTKITVDLSAIHQNVMMVKEHIPSDKKVFAVVKANAYGHGAIQVAKTLEHTVDAFCVSNLDEAIELRESGITLDILLLGVLLPDEIALAKKYKITLTVASLEWVELAIEEKIDLSNLVVHIKVDSGMGRIGFRHSDEVNQVITLLENQGITVEGIFTHFATADEKNEDKFIQQLTFFKHFLSELEYCPKLVHASNSATSLWHCDTIFNAIRLGVAMYGLNPSGNALSLPYSLQPALSLETSIVHVKTLQSGDTVGYGATYRATKEEVIATLPIGYADGFIRDYKGFKVLVDGQFCEIVGRISMDQTTIRLPKKYDLGTLVTLIGQDNQKNISATDLADYARTINYEVICLLSDRIPRYYRGE